LLPRKQLPYLPRTRRRILEGHDAPQSLATLKGIPGYSGDIILIFIDRLVQVKSFIDMAGISRVVGPEYPHHIIQHGVRSMAIFQTGRDLSKGKPGRPAKKGK
jgi:hypothetical protein